MITTQQRIKLVIESEPKCGFLLQLDMFGRTLLTSIVSSTFHSKLIQGPRSYFESGGPEELLKVGGTPFSHKGGGGG